jgi:PEP-CTERM/exosortase A-associated glycosyltransferase
MKPEVKSNIVANQNQSGLKILHILDHSLPLHSGYTFRSHNILREQRKRGWLPVAITSPKHEASWKGQSAAKEEIDGLQYYRSGASNSSIPFWRELRLMKLLANRIEVAARTERPDLLHAHSPILNALPALWVGRKLGIPVVYEVRAFWEDAAVDHGTYSEGSLKYKMVRRMETWVCHRAAQTAVICDGLRSDLIRRGIAKDKISIVPNGVNPEDFESREPDLALAEELGVGGKIVLGFIGSFNRYENLDFLINAVQRLSETRSDVVLVLAGGGEMENDLRAQIERMKIHNRVIMLGRVPHEKIPAIYSLIDVFVYPRYSIRLTELVTPLKPLESMAMGKPIVASDIGGHRELIIDNRTGVLFANGDVSALLEAMNRVLDSPDLRNRLGARAWEWVRQKRSWEITTSVYLDIYFKAVRTKPEGLRAREIANEEAFSVSPNNRAHSRIEP